MGAIEIREELHKYIEIGDKQFLNTLYKTAKSYIEQKNLDRMIAEGEADIKAGRTYSLEEAKKMVDDWEKE
jgi:hypothetical protein